MWYKQFQQSLLFYPYTIDSIQSKDTGTKPPPSMVDPKSGEKFYECNTCHELNPESKIQWFKDVEEKMKGETVMMPQYDPQRITQSLTAISEYLKPFYQELLNYLEREKLPSPEESEYELFRHLTRWEVQTPYLSTIIQTYPELYDICNYVTSASRLVDICRTLRKENVSEIDGHTLDLLKDLINNPDTYISEFLQISGQPVRIFHDVPLCPDCVLKLRKCDMCGETILPGEKSYTPVWSRNEEICERCIDGGNAYICSICGKAESPDDVISTEEGYICEYCNDDLHRKRTEWASNVISSLDIPVGKNLPIPRKNLEAMREFFNRYINKYGDNRIDEKERGRINHLAEKARFPQESIDYIQFALYNNPNASYILLDIDNSIAAQEYMQQEYPQLASYEDLPFDIEVVENYSKEKPGFTIVIAPSDLFFEYASNKYPNINKVWNFMGDTPHHRGSLAYARCSYDGEENIVINNLQRDADYDNFIAMSSKPSDKDKEAAKWLENTTKQWSPFLLNLVKAMAIAEGKHAYLTHFDQQRKKWARLPIHKSRRAYEKVPEQMGFSLTDPDYKIYDLVEKVDESIPLYQLANTKTWYKKANEIPDTLEEQEQQDIPETPPVPVRELRDVQAGQPSIVRVYHGTPDGRFLPEFDPNRKGYYDNDPEALPDNTLFIQLYGGIQQGFQDTSITGNIGVSFTDNPRTARSYANKPTFDYQNSVPMVVERYVLLKNPEVMDMGGREWKHTVESDINAARGKGHDSLVLKNIKDDYHPQLTRGTSNNVIVFDTSQISTNPQVLQEMTNDLV